MRPRRQISVLLASVALLSGCGFLGGSDAVPPTRPPSVPASADPSEAPPTSAATPSAVPSPEPTIGNLDRFYDQKVNWQNCGAADCAVIKAPLDYADPDGDTIDLAITRVRATGDAIGSLFVNPGGPGGSAFDYAQAANGVVTPKIRERFDVVGVDPRGVGRSTPAECLSDRQVDAVLAADGTPDSAAEEQEVADTSRMIAETCESNGGRIVGHMSTVESARDLDLARALVKDDVLNYLGKSYGTMLGATYAELFPDRVGRMVLDGVLPPELDLVEVTRGQAEAFEVAIRDFARDCLTHDDCPLSGTTDEAVQQVRDFFQRVESTPLKSGTRELNEALATYAVLSHLYFPASDYPQLRAGLSAAMERDDPAPLFVMLDSRISRTPDGRYTDNSTSSFYAVTCLDRPWSGTIDEVRALAADLQQTAPTFGTYLAWGLLPCNDWPATTSPVTNVTASGSNPILVVSTRKDPATPYQWGELLASRLENAGLLTWEGVGHTAYFDSSSCIDDAVDAYLLKGEMPEDGLVCQ